MKLLILDEGYRGRLKSLSGQVRGGDVVAAKLDAFHSRERPLRARLGLRIEHIRATLEQVPRILADRAVDADAVLFVPSWQHPVETFQATLAAIPDRPDRPYFALFDTFDQTSSPYFGCLPAVDLYLKSQLLCDESLYKTTLAGGNLFTEWVQNHLGFDLGAWNFGTTVPDGYEARLACGWNMGVSRIYRHLADVSRVVGTAWRQRPIQLNRRFSIPNPAKVAKWEWYQEYRRYCGLRASDLTGDFRLTSHLPVARLAYQRELWHSQIVFSPFGWGEVCFRDFEAIACGAVLVKPDMSHLKTFPDVYEDKATYMAVRWDLSDLPDVCRWLLDNPTEAEQIADRARQRLKSYLAGGGFDSSVASLMARFTADQRRPHSPSPSRAPQI